MEPNDIIESLTKPLVPDVPYNVRKWIESNRKPMTREEALKDLKHFRDYVYWDGMSEEALDMAIEALEQQKEERGLYDAVNSILNKLMDDTWNNRYPHYELIKGYCLEVLKLIELGVKGGE